MRIGIKVAVVLLGLGLKGHCDQGWERANVALLWENDATYQTDRHYTQGARLSYYSRDGALPRWLSRIADGLPACGFEHEAAKWGASAGQDIYTPEDLDNPALDATDRPYAAWIFAGLKLQRRGRSGIGGTMMENVRVDVGVVGPDALGRETQGLVHTARARGWEHQLETETGFIVSYDRRYLYRNDLGDDWKFDLIPRFEIAAGNILTYGALGATARIGINTPNEFEANAGQDTIWKYGGYFFVDLEGRVVGRNIFLDGNTLRESHFVEKTPFVGDFRIGLTFVLKRFEVTVAQTVRLREFDGQKHNDSFGTFMLLMKF